MVGEASDMCQELCILWIIPCNLHNVPIRYFYPQCTHTFILWQYYSCNSPNKLFFPHFSSVQFSRSVVSDSLRPHEPQHARPPRLSPAPGVHPNLCPSSPWCHPTTSSSVFPSSSCPQFSPASGSFPMSQFFASGGQSIGAGLNQKANDNNDSKTGWGPHVTGSSCWL